MNHDIPAKANRVFAIIVLALILIGARVWHLGVTQREEYVKEAKKPTRRTLIESPERATIRDRFNVPLAVNKIQYNAAISYAEIRRIPRIKWEKSESGKKIKFFARQNYVSSLARLLGEELSMDPQEIEDIIYAKASLFPQIPFVIKEKISEKEYYRLRILEKDWKGVVAERKSCRLYPEGKVASSVIGFLGAIPQRKYLAIARKIEELEAYLKSRERGELVPLPRGFENTKEVRRRLKELQEKAYTINDKVGKAGIEGFFDENLRGYFGKKEIEVDMRGNFVRELPGSRPSESGERILLTLSLELQKFAEELLAEYETKVPNFSLGDPWIKGGSIVAMLPQTGEVVALASSPRFDPNDFVTSHRPSLNKWLETENYIADVWNGKRPLEKECYSKSKGGFYEERLSLTWENYLSFILSPNSEVRKSLDRMGTIKNVFLFQETLLQLMGAKEQKSLFECIDLLYSNEKIDPSYLPLKKKIDPYLCSIRAIRDKLLLIDLCRLLVDQEKFTPELIAEIGDETLSSYRSLTTTVISLQDTMKQEIRKLYREIDFKKWRESHFKEYLQEKRKQEKARGRYERPYTDYLTLAEKDFFSGFWNEFRTLFLETMILGKYPSLLDEVPALKPYLSFLLRWHNASQEILPLKKRFLSLSSPAATGYLKTFRSFEELTYPLYGNYRIKKKTKGELQGKDLAAAFYPLFGFGYTSSQAYRQSAPQGSVFKVVTGYEAMRQRWELFQTGGEPLNPLTLKDDMHFSWGKGKDLLLGSFLNGQPIYRSYKGGRLPRANHLNIGTIDIVGALEQSSNMYFSILAGDHLEEPQDLVEAARLFGFGEKTGIDLPGEFAGYLPNDVDVNRTGLYSLAIGQHSLVVTPLQTAVMFGALANGGSLLKPEIVHLTAGTGRFYEAQDPFLSFKIPYQEYLNSVGIHFPLFTEALLSIQKPFFSARTKELKRQVLLPKEMRDLLFEGMQKTISGSRGTARLGRLRTLFETEEQYRQHVQLKDNVIGKTGTAEILHHPFLDAASSPIMRKHVWFASIAFDKNALPIDLYEKPELVVVVYLRFGDAGRIGAPLALRMINKWREICEQKAQKLSNKGS